MVVAETTTRHGRHEGTQVVMGRPRASTPPSAGDGFAVDLLRNLDPARLILYEGRRPDRDEWDRHCGQRSDFVIVATQIAGETRRVAGTLEFRIAAGEHGDQGRIDRLYVESRYRRRGIASRLLRATIAFARERGLATLRENIPAVLVREPGSDLWRPHVPGGESWGGLRSLGATVNACSGADQPCAVAPPLRGRGAVRKLGERRRERLDATLTLPIAPAALAGTPRARRAPDSAALLDCLLHDLAALAGVSLAVRASPTGVA